jgi:hypothetical protein
VIGKLTKLGIALDYTATARPLTVELIEEDINELVLHYDAYPDEIVLWEHQWNWMTKDVDNTGSYLCGAPDARVGYKSIVGTRVRIANT